MGTWSWTWTATADLAPTRPRLSLAARFPLLLLLRQPPLHLPPRLQRPPLNDGTRIPPLCLPSVLFLFLPSSSRSCLVNSTGNDSSNRRSGKRTNGISRRLFAVPPECLLLLWGRRMDGHATWAVSISFLGRERGGAGMANMNIETHSPI